MISLENMGEVLMSKIEVIINALILWLFILAAMVAIYIVVNNSAPWKLISIYWITLAIKNGMDLLKRIGE